MSPFLLLILTHSVHIYAQQTMKLQLMPKNEEGGQCLDGSPAGFYYSPPPSGASNLWIIQLEGGGACHDEASCQSRANTSLGSSNYWKPTKTGNAVMSDNNQTNPDFYSGHKVHAPYCSGDVWSGQRTKPSKDPDTWGFYFSGHLIFERIMEFLSTNLGVLDAEYVLLTGGSAGGDGTFANINWLFDEFQQKATNQNITVKAAPVAGWFFPGNTTDQLSDPMMPPNDYPHWLQNQTGGEAHNDSINILYDAYIDPTCAKTLGENNSWHCDSVHNMFPFVKAPVFVMENKYDTNQIQAQFLMPSPQKEVNADTTGYVGYFGVDMERSIMGQVVNGVNKARNGLFFPSCYDHGTGLGIGSGTTVINGYKSTELVGDWFWERNQLPHFVYDTCNTEQNLLPCNPTCHSYPSD